MDVDLCGSSNNKITRILEIWLGQNLTSNSIIFLRWWISSKPFGDAINMLAMTNETKLLPTYYYAKLIGYKELMLHVGVLVRLVHHNSVWKLREQGHGDCRSRLAAICNGQSLVRSHQIKIWIYDFFLFNFVN